jgi:hypothetical protein
MRKFIILIMSLCTWGVLVSEAWAARVSIAGRHSQSEIQGTCDAVGGDFFSLPTGQYGCSNICAQASASCVVTCGSDGKCFGDCPRCGRRVSSRSPLPRLAGQDAVTRVLNNLTTTRAGGPGYGYGPGPYPGAVIVNPVTGRWCRTEPSGYQICWTP